MNMKPIKTRKAWTAGDIAGLLKLYGYFLACQRGGTAYTKAAPVRELAAKQGRSKGSIEAKMMNVSAVLVSLSLDYVTGYKPLPNYNQDLVDQVTDWVAERVAA
jgi:hypothetical protein